MTPGRLDRRGSRPVERATGARIRCHAGAGSVESPGGAIVPLHASRREHSCVASPPLALIAVAGLALGAAACGSSSSSSSASTTTTTSRLGRSPPRRRAPRRGSTELKDPSSSLGDIVVDGEGRTLYLFTADNGTTTACTGGCATAWPALVAPVTAGSGVTGAVTEATQADGAKQIALNGHLLYYYAADAAPGATSGQGVGGQWYVVDGAGNAITKAPGAPAPATDPEPRLTASGRTSLQ